MTFCMHHKWTDWILKSHLIGYYYERTCKKCGKVETKGYYE